MEINKIAKALLDACEDCSERLSCDAGTPRSYCPNRDAAARLVALNDFLNTQCAKLLRDLTDANAKIAELQEENQAVMEMLANELGCPYDYYAKLFYSRSDDPNFPDWYFKICNSERFTCAKTEKQTTACWTRQALGN